jgi:hypothetical protein
MKFMFTTKHGGASLFGLNVNPFNIDLTHSKGVAPKCHQRPPEALPSLTELTPKSIS